VSPIARGPRFLHRLSVRPLSICGPGRRKGIRSFFAGDSSETCHLNLLDRNLDPKHLHSWGGSAVPAHRIRGRHRRPGRNRSLADHSRGGRRAPSYANLAGRRHRGRAQSAAEQRFWLRGFEDRTRVEQHALQLHQRERFRSVQRGWGAGMSDSPAISNPLWMPPISSVGHRIVRTVVPGNHRDQRPERPVRRSGDGRM